MLSETVLNAQHGDQYLVTVLKIVPNAQHGEKYLIKFM